jgi:hypothetical protein
MLVPPELKLERSTHALQTLLQECKPLELQGYPETTPFPALRSKQFAAWTVSKDATAGGALHWHE